MESFEKVVELGIRTEVYVRRKASRGLFGAGLSEMLRFTFLWSMRAEKNSTMREK
jgi:hypothetical protein